jgi:hypothetical protein
LDEIGGILFVLQVKPVWCGKYIGSDYRKIPPQREVDEPLQALIFDSLNPFRVVLK